MKVDYRSNMKSFKFQLRKNHNINIVDHTDVIDQKVMQSLEKK